MLSRIFLVTSSNSCDLARRVLRELGLPQREPILLLQDGDRNIGRINHSQLIGQLLPLEGQVQVAGLPLDGGLERIELCWMGYQWTRDALHHRDALGTQHVLGDPVQHQHVGRIAHVVVDSTIRMSGFIRAWVKCRSADAESDVHRRIGQEVPAVVVGRFYSRGRRTHTDQDHERAGHQDRCRASRTTVVPTLYQNRPLAAFVRFSYRPILAPR